MGKMRYNTSKRVSYNTAHVCLITVAIISNNKIITPLTKGYEETFWGDAIILYLDCGGDFKTIHLSQLTLKGCILLYM